MKKIIIAIISAMIMMPAMADAQIQIKKNPKVETIKSVRMGWVSLMTCEGYYSLAIRSDNQFDKAYIIHLGDNKDKAEQSLTSLIELASTMEKDDSYEIDNHNGKIRVSRGMTKGEIWFKDKSHAGWGKTHKTELSTLLKALQE